MVTCGNKATVFRVDGGVPASPTLSAAFQVSRVFDRPASLPNSNFEGIGIAPETECVGGQKPFFWSTMTARSTCTPFDAAPSSLWRGSSQSPTETERR